MDVIFVTCNELDKYRVFIIWYYFVIVLLMQIMFETFNASAFYVAIQSVLSLCGSGWLCRITDE